MLANARRNVCPSTLVIGFVSVKPDVTNSQQTQYIQWNIIHSTNAFNRYLQNKFTQYWKKDLYKEVNNVFQV